VKAHGSNSGNEFCTRVNGARRNTDREITKREIVDYGEQMLALNGLMVDLKHRRFALNEKLNRTSSIISMLPLDVISEIFFLVYEVQDKRNFGILRAPFILGRICKAWRQIVWSTPRIWSTIMIRFASKKYAAQEQLLKEWFYRVGNCQLCTPILRHLRSMGTAGNHFPFPSDLLFSVEITGHLGVPWFFFGHTQLFLSNSITPLAPRYKTAPA